MTQLIAFDISAYEKAVKEMILQKVGCPQPTIEMWEEIMEESLNPNAHVVDCDGEMWFPYLLIGEENVLDCISIGDLQAYLLEQYTLATFALPSAEIVIPNDDDPQQVKVEMYHNGISVLSHPNKVGDYTREALVDFCGEQTIRYREDPNGTERCEQEFEIVATL